MWVAPLSQVFMDAVKLSDEEVERFNNRLKDLFGIDTVTSQAMWRIVWSDDQLEMQLTECNDKGIYFAQPVMREVRKYNWIHARYILEHLAIVPDTSLPELSTKIAYGNIWTFEDAKGEYLPPRIDACQFVINTVVSAMQRHRDGLSPIKKYIDEEYSQDASLEAKEKRIAEYTEYLFGDQSSLQGTTKTGESIIVPRTFEKSN